MTKKKKEEILVEYNSNGNVPIKLTKQQTEDLLNYAINKILEEFIKTHG
jgi:hypothetical protein